MKQERIIIAGGSGFLGQALAKHLTQNHREIVILTRSPNPTPAYGREISWDGETLGHWAQQLEGAKSLINLTGRSVDCRYTPANRRILIDSRVKPTRVLGEAIAQCKNPPKVWLNASSATIYRHTFGPAWDENGTDFSPTPEVRDEFSLKIIEDWEREFNRASVPGVRRIALLTTMVLGHGRNSVFPVLCRLASLGLGGRMGSGKQYVSWIHDDDFCRAIEWLIEHPEINGPVNVAAPNPLPNAEMMSLFREQVGIAIGLPATNWMLEIGAFVMRTETELILKSRRVVPGKLLAHGFEFAHPDFAEALKHLYQTKP